MLSCVTCFEHYLEINVKHNTEVIVQEDTEKRGRIGWNTADFRGTQM